MHMDYAAYLVTQVMLICDRYLSNETGFLSTVHIFLFIFQLVYNLTDDAYIDYVKSRIDDNRTFDYRYYSNDLGKNDKGI
jgi:hypothetical protein